jgi:NarL family two-component system response regulator LiaR
LINENPAERSAPLARILLIEDHPLTRHGLASCLEDTGRFRIAAQAGSLEEARRFVEGPAVSLPEIIILNIMMGEENGLEFLSFLKEFCGIRKLRMPAVLVCSVFEDPFRIRTAVGLGASGYISKAASEAEFLRAIETLLAGETFIDPRLRLKINEAPDVYGKFTRREQKVLSMVKQNYTNQRIAKALTLSLRTVENHISHIYLKTGCNTRQELLDF